MNKGNLAILDANEAAANVAYRLSEVIAIYPITPSSAMAEFCDEWRTQGKKNIWGIAPEIVQLQSESGVAGAIHGALQSGTLATTFTASQGLLLMLPNMFKIAGELLPFCMHVAARSVATHALSIFGDHSDVMACRSTGFAFLCSSSVQEAHDMAAIAHAVTLETRVPFLHFFDGFRTSHEMNNCKLLTDDELRQLIDGRHISAMRQRALTPDRPTIRGTAQNPDVFFQGREASNIFYDKVPEILEKYFEKFESLTGRRYNLFEYGGHGGAEHVAIAMGSGAETLRLTATPYNRQQDMDYLPDVGAVKVRLFRPFSAAHLLAAIPKTARTIGVLDRTKEPGALGEPLFLDVAAAIQQSKRNNIRVIGGRYGLGSKEFTPEMARTVFEILDLFETKGHLERDRGSGYEVYMRSPLIIQALQNGHPRHDFTVGIDDDVTHRSIDFRGKNAATKPYDYLYYHHRDKLFQAIFYGLGSDGTVGANKNTVKIISDETDQYAQAYFVYDSKKSGAMTISHLRFGLEPIEAPYLIQEADFVACHQFSFLNRLDILKNARHGATLLINSPHGKEQTWAHLVREVQEDIVKKNLKIYIIDAYGVARAAGMGGRINTIMQTCFFAISGVLAKDEAIEKIKQSIQKTYAKKGAEIIQKNCEAVDKTLENLFEFGDIAALKADNPVQRAPIVGENAPDFVKNTIARIMANEGNELPVSAMPIDGTWPAATAQWEKRSIAQEIPQWDPAVCIQCNKCSAVCPHGAIRAKYYPEVALQNAPEGFRAADFRSRDPTEQKFTLQVAPEDCTGCALCDEVCPAKSKQNPGENAISMVPKAPVLEREKQYFEYFQSLPQPHVASVTDIKSSQFRRPLFEFSGACSGCGETPYIKLLTQLFGDHLLIANATGCSSIYGGNLPTTPYATDGDGHGPAWANSLFEDNAEFGFGIKIATEKKRAIALELLERHATIFGDDLIAQIKNSTSIGEQRQLVAAVQMKIQEVENPAPELTFLGDLSENLVRKTTWIIGGDGWAYDIGYGGLDHILASGTDINVLILDTEVYSNTGGQQSKATPAGAIAKFAAAGKSAPKKDIGLLAISYGNIYVAQVALGANDAQTAKAMLEADAYAGPSLLIAYCPCIAHGFDLRRSLEQQKKAVASGHWPLYRFNPQKKASGQTGFSLDSKEPTIDLEAYTSQETRFSALQRSDPERAQQFLRDETARISAKYDLFKRLR
ncbi:MAG: pyruvate:ferredoxin (flavodoxin) oxidoreductase [Puniceicoccales bacterium]|jgi:pyruvate-ferredoxin/flavodoxin oxidoreductase|nr:pyruvate:ferredoxin (flavodoxin) oxidoreductase [Puniceicoccales bacterium]